MGKSDEPVLKKFKPARVTLVTVICPSELAARVEELVRHLGATGYTVANVNGFGQHGSRRNTILDAGNVRLETIVTRDIATRILLHVDTEYAQMPIIAFAHDVDAVPRNHFVKETLAAHTKR
jgi:nitrogen regulatory protein PII